MENALGEDIPVGVYRTTDKITNFKIKVKVRKIANACFTESDSLALRDSNELELVNLMKSSTISAERVFKWQEKAEKFKDASGRKENSSKNDSITISLFSYNENDILSSQWKNYKSYTSPSSKPTHLEMQISQMKPKTRLYFPDGKTWQKPFFSSIKRIVKEKRSLKETCVSAGQSMAIMAALLFEDSASIEEINLCFLQVDDHGTLTVIPDFSQKKSYVFINSRSETFEYEIENVSNTPKSLAIQRERSLMKKIALYKRKKEGSIIDEFSKLALEMTSFTINFEIVSAKDFPSTDMYIHYLIIIPKGCSSENTLEGVTETCRKKSLNNSTVAYYGYTFSIDISANVNEFRGEPLKIIFEGTSIDYWGNFRNEGYGYSDIPMIPGMTSHDISTWKIEPDQLRHKLQNFFIGGMPHLDDISYIINPKDIQDSHLSKYGVRTISSGIVTFKSSIIQQVKP